MQESKQEKAEAKKSTEELKAERQSDATDDEVLKVEESGSGSESKTKDEGGMPSPDGTFDESDETKAADPM